MFSINIKYLSVDPYEDRFQYIIWKFIHNSRQEEKLDAQVEMSQYCNIEWRANSVTYCGWGR